MHDSTERVEHFAGVPARTSVDHALRAVQQNFTQLSIAADHKANIVIGSTLVMLGLLVGTVHSARAPVAAYVMGGFALLSCLFALLGVLPRVSHWRSDHRSGHLPARPCTPAQVPLPALQLPDFVHRPRRCQPGADNRVSSVVKEAAIAGLFSAPAG